MRAKIFDERGNLIEIQEDGQTIREFTPPESVRRKVDKRLKERGLIDEQGRPNVQLQDNSRSKAVGLGERVNES